VKVETNAVSPPTARFSAPINPPFSCDCRSTLPDIATIAPASALIDCSACNFTVASANAP
jgi:hypothetical protein